MKNNKGITLVELIIVMALIFIVLPFAWDYINSSIQDNATLNNKVAVQTSVNALMTQIQRDIQEARYPINPTDNYDDVATGFLICKPGNTSVIYSFDEDKNEVSYKNNLILERDGFNINNVKESEDTEFGIYQYIKEITMTKVDANGITVHIRGEIDEKSGYTLTNTYYTRNTIF